MRKEINLFRTLKSFRFNVSRRNPFVDDKPLLYRQMTLGSNNRNEKPFWDQKIYFSTFGALNYFTSSKCYFRGDSKPSNVMNFFEFEEIEDKNKRTFNEMIKMYELKFPTRKGVVDFIYMAMKHMEKFGVEGDLETYKKLINLMPKGPYVPSNRFQAELKYFPREQDCILDLLMMMEDFDVMPDVEMGDILCKIFGEIGYPTKKFYRMMYWMPKFKNLSPWPLPKKKIARDSFALAKLAIERITSVDLQTEISVFRTEEIADSIDKTWIVSGQSPKQRSLLESHPPEKPVIVEGGDHVWLECERINYFVLKSEDVPYIDKPPENKDDVSNLQVKFLNPEYKEEENDEDNVHRQDDGIIYAVCATGTSQKDSLLSWIRLLQSNGNPALENLAVLFRFRKPLSQPVPFSDELTSTNEKGETSP